MIWTIFSFIIIFSFIVVSHEFGHFLIGRLNGIVVKEFMVGVGPALLKKKCKSGMIFSIRLLPFGGACVFKGSELDDSVEDDDSDEDESMQDDSKSELSGNTPALKNESDLESEDALNDGYDGSFKSCPAWGRVATLVAGPVFNVILAFLLSVFMCWFCGSDLPVVYSVSEGLPAQEAGITAGDRIVSINNHNVYLWREVSLYSLMNDGEPLNIEYERGGEVFETVINPYYADEEARYYIGMVGGVDYAACNNLSVFKYAAIEVRYWVIATVKSLGYMFNGHASLDDLSGPVGIATVIDDTIEETSDYGVFVVILNMINITVLLSVNVGLMNLLPVPALDGGRLLIALFEAVFKKEVPESKESIFHMIGAILLIILMVVVLFNDIMKIFR